MRLTTILMDLDLYRLFETVLADFVLAFTFFTALCYAVLGKRFGMQRPAAAMSGAIGFSLAVGLIWWERATGFSIKDLGPIAIGFAVIAVAFVMYQAVRQIGGSWAGAAITLGVSIIIARILELNIPIDPEVIQVITMVALITGILALVSYTRGNPGHVQRVHGPMPRVRHDMTDLYRGRKLSDRLTKGMKKLRKQVDTRTEQPAGTPDVLTQLRRMLPAEGYLTERMAQLRAKAHRVRNGHIARLEETCHVFAKLPASAKKKASAKLTAGYGQIIGVDTRLERLDKAVAENELRIRELTKRAQGYAARYDYKRLSECLKAAEKLQHHNSRLFKVIERTEGKLAAVARKVAQQSKEADQG